MREVSMYFGKTKGKTAGNGGMQLVAKGTVATGSSASIESFAPGGGYLLLLAQYEADSGFTAGQALYLITSPAGDAFGGEDLSYVALGSTGRLPTLSWGSSVTITVSSSNLSAMYTLYKLR